MFTERWHFKLQHTRLNPEEFPTCNSVVVKAEVKASKLKYKYLKLSFKKN